MEEIVPIKIEHGEEKSWEHFCIMLPDVVCREAGVEYDAKEGFYIINSFGMDFKVFSCENRIASDEPGAELFLEKLKDFFLL